jgi:dCMP deaminase
MSSLEIVLQSKSVATLSTVATRVATLYINLSPCKNCSKLILQSGIKRVVYSKQHSCQEGINFLKQQGVECNFLNIE